MLQNSKVGSICALRMVCTNCTQQASSKAAARPARRPCSRVASEYTSNKVPTVASNDGNRNDARTEPKAAYDSASSQKYSGGLSW